MILSTLKETSLWASLFSLSSIFEQVNNLPSLPAKGEVLMLVIDGRQPLHSVGATMKDCQDILVAYGAVNSAALDGGSSSIMYYEGAIQTKPSNGTSHGRYLPSAWVVYE